LKINRIFSVAFIDDAKFGHNYKNRVAESMEDVT
jgi:hypothetical protein